MGASQSHDERSSAMPTPGYIPGSKSAGVLSIVGLVVLILLIILILYAVFSSRRRSGFGRRR